MRPVLLLALVAAVLAAAGCGGGGGGGGTATAERTAARVPAHTAAPARHPPVVFLMFDEFDTSELFDRAMKIDPVRYPNMAALARQATFYRRFTAAGDITGPASGSLLASRPYELHDRGVLENFPDNIFTRYRRAGYGLVVRESATNLCPHCAGDHAPRNAHDVRHYLGDGRVGLYENWLKTLRRPRRPTLFFDHTLLPHGPLVYTQSAHRYRYGGDPIRQLGYTPSFFDPWLVREQQQRYIMQMELVDLLVGQLVARMKATGLWNRATLVITADNGEGWGHLGSDPHRIDRHTVAQIVQTPLFLHRPGQRRGGYSDMRVRTGDLLPTLAGLSHVGLGRTSGVSMLGARARRIPASPIVATDDHGRAYLLTARRFGRVLRQVVDRRIAVFGQHTRDLFHIGPSPRLVGQPLSDLHVTAARAYHVTWLGTHAQLRHVDLRSETRPVEVEGILRGPRARRGMPLAVSVNGTVVATARTARMRGSRTTYVVVMVPEESLRQGRNDVRLFLLQGGTLARVSG